MKEASSDAKDSGQGVLEEVYPPVGHKGEEERWMIQKRKISDCSTGNQTH